MPRPCPVLIPIYRSFLDEHESFALGHSLRNLRGRDVRFIAPLGMDVSLYQSSYPEVRIEYFEARCFASIQEYNRLLLSGAFYERFRPAEFLLILQTDAIILKDDLDFWMSRPFDYIGAPWPGGHDLKIEIPPFDGKFARQVKAFVGNGGLSLRRINACIDLLEEFPVALQVFLQTGSSEDLFFAFMGLLSKRFVLPNEMTASLFSLELAPEDYYTLNSNTLPMGVHAWRKYAPQFWEQILNAPR